MNRTRRRMLVRTVLVLLVFTAVGAACGYLWAEIWDPATGVVIDHTWYPSPWETGQQAQFDATGWYVVIAAAAGLVLGLLAALIAAGSELVMLVTVLLGSLLGAWTMRWVGLAQGPPDPQHLAASLPDNSTLPSAMELWGPATWLAFPFGAMLALTIVFLLLGRTRLPEEPGPGHAAAAGSDAEPVTHG
ncbi:hypothetical protein [Nocardioides insulae]|uniref:hypothetical protein n=1 Tax=Nocardioides insulae TaxID=394734 RepID=UPI00041C5559|nr:hypothetical protein [Nocardioides insulae]